ncbi:MAG TPA: Na+/H+ antiporter subunit G [Azoarcus sp.]|nr:Na+/H+ antiporter subunit G [Azoarcus sp.]
MSFLAELFISMLVVIGGFFLLVGSLGLARLPELMSRLHAPTKATSLGIGCALLASVVYFLIEQSFSIHEILITFFLFLTAPVTAHFISKAYLHQHRERADALPDTGRDCGWSTFDHVSAQKASAANKRG